MSMFAIMFRNESVNSSPPSVTYASSLVQIMACRQFSTKPLPEPMLPYCQLNSWEQISVKFELKFYHSHSIKCILKCRLPKWRPFCSGWDELTECFPVHFDNGILSPRLKYSHVAAKCPIVTYIQRHKKLDLCKAIWNKSPALKPILQWWPSILTQNASVTNSSPPSAAYMCQWTRSALVQVRACRLFSAKPLPEPMLVYCQ